ncbi:hypothetical protein [Plantibacter sp. YIM 135347]|uniref:hypothetical protein n=1 Tax=Plantibacter sp. YIM 135347 TaxID=3423919 RepID=UPI003D3346D9
MPKYTAPDRMPFWDRTEPVADLNEKLEDLAKATQAAFDQREQHTFVWVDEAARNLEKGMVQGDVGYQLDTKTPYRFDGGIWRLATPHMEFTASKSNFQNATITQIGLFALDAANSTSANLAKPGTDGIIRIADPGLYNISSLTRIIPGSASGRTFLDLATTLNDVGLLQRISISAGEDTGSISLPNLRVTAPDLPLYFKIYRVTPDISVPAVTRARITRVA